MRRHEPAPVGNRSPQVGYLQRSGQYFALSDGNTNNGQPVPTAAIRLVIELGVGYESSLFARQVRAQPVSEALRHHVVFPHRDGILGRTIFLVAEHVIKPPTEIGVTRSGNGRHKGEGRGMAMATDPQSPVDKPVRTRIARTFLAYNAFLQKGHGLCRLEGASRRICALDGTVQ